MTTQHALFWDNFYAITFFQGIHGILRNRCIASSTDITRDAILGRGVYLTDIDPWNDSYKIAMNNWDDGKN